MLNASSIRVTLLDAEIVFEPGELCEVAFVLQRQADGVNFLSGTTGEVGDGAVPDPSVDAPSAESPALAKAKPRLFLSYGRRDAKDLAGAFEDVQDLARSSFHQRHVRWTGIDFHFAAGIATDTHKRNNWWVGPPAKENTHVSRATILRHRCLTCQRMLVHVPGCVPPAREQRSCPRSPRRRLVDIMVEEE